jgi:hypothetical protein
MKSPRRRRPGARGGAAAPADLLRSICLPLLSCSAWYVAEKMVPHALGCGGGLLLSWSWSAG